MSEYISEEQWWQFFQNGYLKLGKVLQTEELAALRQRINEIMLGVADIDYNQIRMQLDSNTGVYQDWRTRRTAGGAS